MRTLKYLGISIILIFTVAACLEEKRDSLIKKANESKETYLKTNERINAFLDASEKLQECLSNEGLENPKECDKFLKEMKKHSPPAKKEPLKRSEENYADCIIQASSESSLIECEELKP